MSVLTATNKDQKTKLINAKEIRKANGHLQGVQPANLWTFNQLDTGWNWLNQKLDVYTSAFPISNCCPGNLLCKMDCSRGRWMASLDVSNLIQIIKNRRIKYNHVSSWVLSCSQTRDILPSQSVNQWKSMRHHLTEIWKRGSCTVRMWAP